MKVKDFIEPINGDIYYSFSEFDEPISAVEFSEKYGNTKFLDTVDRVFFIPHDDRIVCLITTI